MTLIHERPHRCRVCCGPVEPWISKVEDRIYGVAGEWSFVRCAGAECGVIYLDHDLTVEQLAGFYAGYGTHSPPVLTARGVKRLYRDALAAVQQRQLGYAGNVERRARWIGGVLERIAFFRQSALSRLFWLPARVDGRVLEVGFGNGQALAQLRSAGWNVVGCEFDSICIAQARALNFEVHEGGLIDAQFAADSFDAVVANHAIEHVPDPAAFVREAARVLKPGGRMVLVTPNAASRDARRYGADWRGLEVPRHLSIHTPQSLARMAQDAGFARVEVFGTPLGGFILQQTRELHAGKPVSPRQNWKTMIYNLRAARIAKRNHLDSEEIVLSCEMSG